MSVTKQQVRELFDLLGDSPDQVAETLRAGGFSGHPGSGEECPLANFFREETGEPNVFVSSFSVKFFSFGENPVLADPELEMRLSAPVLAFVHQLDCGCYSDLRE